MIIVQNTQRVVIPKDGAIFWTGTTAPKGWEFFNTVNNYYLMGASANNFTAAGELTHFHNNTGSTPSAAGHSNHGNGITVQKSDADASGAWAYAGSAYACPSGHGHGVTIYSQSTSPSHSHAYGDTDSKSNEPPYITLRLIKALSDTTMPIGGIIMTKTANSNPLMLVCDGTNGTPDMRGKYVKCYTSTLLSGGSSSHSHASISCGSGGAHTHTISMNISKAYASGAVAQGTTKVGDHTHNSGSVVGKESLSAGAHTHTATIDSTSIIPSWYGVNYLKSSALISTPLDSGNIIIWLGGTIPSGWSILETLYNRFPKGISSIQSLGDVGGANTHTHSIAQTSSAGDHTHTIAEFQLSDVGGRGSASLYQNPNLWTFNNHHHMCGGTLNSTGSHTHGGGTTDSANNLPPYMRVIYIVKN